jgi:hypothetical protein
VILRYPIPAAITDAGVDETFLVGQAVVVTGTTFLSPQGAGLVKISPTDNFNDGDAVTQVVTAWSDTSITFTAARDDLLVGVPLYLFVQNNIGGRNAAGFPVQFVSAAPPSAGGFGFIQPIEGIGWIE